MRLAIFDVDGTLVDSRSMITAAMPRAFADVGIAAPDQDRMLSIVGLSLVDAMAALTPDESPRPIGAWARPTSRPSGSSACPAPIRKTCSMEHGTCWKTCGAGAWSSASPPASRAAALTISLPRMVSRTGSRTVQTSDTHPSKPHPSMIVTALAETGCDPSATIMIGDTSFDMSMARQAGVAAAGVAWGNHPATELVTAGAHRVSKNFKQLALDLEALWEERGR